MRNPDAPETDFFPNTRWTLVQQVGDGGEHAERALGELCSIYWRPVYAYARAAGLSPEDAEDITQGFFSQLIGNGALGRADASKGRLRSYLLNALKNYRIDQHRRQSAQKRGGGSTVIQIDVAAAEGAIAAELADHQNPERLFERRWALTLLDEAFERLAAEYQKSNQADLYAELRPTLIDGPDPHHTHAKIASKLDMSPGAVQVAAHRLRKRYRRTLESVVAETLENPGEVATELRHVLGALAVHR